MFCVRALHENEPQKVEMDNDRYTDAAAEPAVMQNTPSSSSCAGLVSECYTGIYFVFDRGA